MTKLLAHGCELRIPQNMGGFPSEGCPYPRTETSMELLSSQAFWIGLAQIIWINIILSGDNAVVIALAARSLPAEQQRKANLFGQLSV